MLCERSREGEITTAASQKSIIKLIISDRRILNSLELDIVTVTEIRRSWDERDIDISIKNQGKLMNQRYQIFPSPHEPPTKQKYKNDAKAFYQAAFNKWASLFTHEIPFPNEFVFKAYNHDFNAIPVADNGDPPVDEKTHLQLAISQLEESVLYPDDNENTIVDFIRGNLTRNQYRRTIVIDDREIWEKEHCPPINFSIYLNKDEAKWILHILYQK